MLATDHFCWSGEGWGTKAGFELARRALGSRVEDRDIDVFGLSPQSVGEFDIVLFLGVLYHMRDPLGALERAASVARELLIVETEVDLLWRRRPAAAFYPAGELNGDPTNWWGPNPAAVRAMLLCAGFARAEMVDLSPSLPFRLAKAAVRFAAKGASPFTTAQRARAVFHAYRSPCESE
ncbi:MAG: hypothetical protein BWZ10_02848 [candidate division BRC1 bacterium ADurb.BinA364]|nr:MAG: hypothetical protein BWZ10_02848 [candidate division BRC1 bacterium ADurb.BinA364]